MGSVMHTAAPGESSPESSPGPVKQTSIRWRDINLRIVIPTATASMTTTAVASSWVDTGTTGPIAAKNQSRGARPRKVARR